MASNDSDYNPSDNNNESDVDRVSVTSSDSDVEDHMILSDRLLLLGDDKRKRNRGFYAERRHPNGVAMMSSKNLPWLRTKCSIIKVNNLKRIITNPLMREAVMKMGFGSLLRMENIRMPLRFLRELVGRFNPYRSALIDHHGMQMEIGTLDVGSAIGVSCRGKKFPEIISNERERELRMEFGMIDEAGEDHKLPLTAVEERLTQFNSATDEFKKWFLLYVQTCYLCPTTVDVVSTSNLAAVSVAAKAEDYNWSEYVLRWLRRYSQLYHSVTNKRGVAPAGHGGCLAALMVIYFDSTECEQGIAGPDPTEENLGLICFWKKDKLASRARDELIRVRRARTI